MLRGAASGSIWNLRAVMKWEGAGLGDHVMQAEVGRGVGVASLGLVHSTNKASPLKKGTDAAKRDEAQGTLNIPNPPPQKKHTVNTKPKTCQNCKFELIHSPNA